MKTCPVCQKVLTDQAKFCFFCGASLLNAEPEPVAPEAVDPVVPEEPEATDPIAPEVFEPAFAEAPVAEPEPVLDPAPEPAFVPDPEPVFTPEPEPAPEPEPTPEPVPVAEPKPAEPEPKQPIVLATDSRSLMTTVGYIFTTILFHIPLIGLVFMIVWGCGKTKNLSRKRFSLACLIMRLIGYIVVLAAAVFLLICFSGVFPALWAAVKPILFP